MAKVINNTKVYFNGYNSIILAGTEYADDAPIVLANKDKFLFENKVEKKIAKKVAPKKAPKVEKVEELKEELLIEEPVAAVEVEIVEEAIEVEEKPKRRKRK